LTSDRWAPWTVGQVRLVLGLGLLGAVLIVVAYLGAADEARLDDQFGWLNLGVVGLLVAGVGAGALLLAGRRAIGLRRLRLLRDAASSTNAAPIARGDHDPSLVWLPGSSLVHRLDCQLVRGKDVDELDATGIRQLALRPCEVCA
jgi:hypothetical protein